MCLLSSIFVGLLLNALLAMPAKAALITHVFSGTVTAPGAAPGVSLSDPFTATLSYDDSQAPVGTTGTRDLYAVYSFDLAVNTFSASEDPNSTIAVIDDLFSDGFSTQGTGIGAAGFGLRDSTGTAFSNTTLPTSLSNADFDFNFVAVAFPGTNLNLVGNIIDIQSSVAGGVPEPTTLFLLLFGMGGVGFSSYFRT